MPTDAYRGPGRAECAYMLERVVDLAAKRLGMSPIELRRRNMIPTPRCPGGRPPTGSMTAVTFRLSSKGLSSCPISMDSLAGAAKPGTWKASRIGVAYYIDHTGMGPSDLVLSRGMKIPTYKSSLVRFNKEGGVTVVTGTHTHGQGLETALAQIVSDRFGIPVADIEVLHGDTRDIGYGRGTVGARSCLPAARRLTSP